MLTVKIPSSARGALAALLVIGLPSAGVFTMAAPAAAQASDPLDQAIAALRGITTMQANFTQTDRSGGTLRGVLTLKNPGKIRFDYGKSANFLVVSNGRSLTMIDYDVKRVQRYPLGPLGALLNPSQDVKRFGRLMPTANPNVLSIQVKDPKKPEYPTITMIMVRKAGAPGGLELNSWVAQDAQNKLTTVRLSNQRYGVPVADSAFSYVDPSRKLGPQR